LCDVDTFAFAAAAVADDDAVSSWMHKYVTSQR